MRKVAVSRPRTTASAEECQHSYLPHYGDPVFPLSSSSSPSPSRVDAGRHPCSTTGTQNARSLSAGAVVQGLVEPHTTTTTTTATTTTIIMDEDEDDDNNEDEDRIPPLLSMLRWWLLCSCCGGCWCCEGASDEEDEDETVGLLAGDEGATRRRGSRRDGGASQRSRNGKPQKRKASGGGSGPKDADHQVAAHDAALSSAGNGLEKENGKLAPVNGIPLLHYSGGGVEVSLCSSTAAPTPVSGVHVIQADAARPLSPLRLSPVRLGGSSLPFDSAAVGVGVADPCGFATASSRRSSMSSTTTNTTTNTTAMMMLMHTTSTDAAPAQLPTTMTTAMGLPYRLPSLSASISPSELYEDANALRSAMRQRWTSASVLQHFLTRYSSFLPLQLSVRPDTSVSARAFYGSVEPIVLHVSGPLRRSPHASLLSLMEDVLLEDCDPALPISSIQVADLTFPARSFTTDAAAAAVRSGTDKNAARGPGLSVNPHILNYLMHSGPQDASGNHQNSTNNSTTNTNTNSAPPLPPSAPSAPSADSLAPYGSVSPAAHPSGLPPLGLCRRGGLELEWVGGGGVMAAGASGGGHTDEEESEEYMQQSTTRASIFLRNLLDSAAPTLRSLSFLRLGCTPQDLAFLCTGVVLGAEVGVGGLGVRAKTSSPASTVSASQFLAPYTQLHRLLFEQTPLSPAHVDALVGGLRQRLQLERERHRPPVALSSLQALQLSGAITPDAVDKLLRFLEEAWDVAIPPLSLRRLLLPHAVLHDARRHHLLSAHPELRVEGLGRIAKIAEEPIQS